MGNKLTIMTAREIYDAIQPKPEHYCYWQGCWEQAKTKGKFGFQPINEADYRDYALCWEHFIWVREYLWEMEVDEIVAHAMSLKKWE